MGKWIQEDMRMANERCKDRGAWVPEDDRYEDGDDHPGGEAKCMRTVFAADQGSNEATSNLRAAHGCLQDPSHGG